MAQISSFRALRYDPAKIPNLGDVVAPPYDVISPAQQEELYARSPYNCVRLILGKGEDRHERAARELAAWREAGILVRDETPAIYLVEDRYRVRDASGGEVERCRRGLAGLIRIEGPGARVILPHELTLAAPRDDRLRLMCAVNAHLSHVFMLAPDGDGLLRALCEEASKGETLAEFSEREGASHRLAAVTDAGLLSRIRAALADRPLLIADGHHRYETARAYRDARRAGEKREEHDRRPYEHVMALVASMDDPGITVLGYHRLVRETALAPAALRERMGRVFKLSEVARSSDTGALAALQSAMVTAGRRGEIAFGLGLRGDPALYLASQARDPGAPPLERLDVSVLHAGVLGRILGITEEDLVGQRRVDYTPDPVLALSQVASGSHAAAFLLNPTPTADVLAVALAGEVMPQKSTYFYPKLLTGLTFHPMDPDGAIRDGDA